MMRIREIISMLVLGGLVSGCSLSWTSKNVCDSVVPSFAQSWMCSESKDDIIKPADVSKSEKDSKGSKVSKEASSK